MTIFEKVHPDSSDSYPPSSGLISIKTRDEVEKMAKAGRVVAIVLEELREKIKPGISTWELDKIATSRCEKEGAKPAFLGYRGYPASLCVSINSEVVHGIPSKKRFVEEGDIVSFDFGTRLDGYYGDAAITVGVGKISSVAKRLIEVTELALFAGIEKARVKNRLYDISAEIQRVVETAGFSVVRDFVGHGIGRSPHEPPQIPNFGTAGRGPRLEEGMTLAVEPMVNVGGWEVGILDDGWTAVTKDGSLSAHFEHTIAVTNGEPRILTAV